MLKTAQCCVTLPLIALSDIEYHGETMPVRTNHALNQTRQWYHLPSAYKINKKLVKYDCIRDVEIGVHVVIIHQNVCLRL